MTKYAGKYPKVSPVDSLTVVPEKISSPANYPHLSGTYLHTPRLNHLFIHSREVVLYATNDAQISVLEISDSISTYGYTSAEFSTGERSFRDIIYTDDVAPVTIYINEQVEKKAGTFGLDYRIICKSGEPVWITCVFLPEYDQNGEATHFLIKIKDISRRIQHSEKLQDANENLLVTLKCIGETVILTDAHGYIERLNDAAEKFLGIINLKARRKRLDDVIRFSFSPDFTDTIALSEIMTSSRKILQFDEIFMKTVAYNRQFHVSCNISSIYVGKNKDRLDGFVLVIKDLTGIYNLWQKAHENEIRMQESESTMRDVFENSVDGILLADSNGIVEEWSRGYESITGITKEMAIGKRLWDVVLSTLPPEQQTGEKCAALQAEQESVMISKQQKMITRHVIHQQTGEHKILSVLYFPVTIPGKTMMGAISRDITDLKNAEAELQRYHESLERLVKERTEELEATNEELFTANEELVTINDELNQKNEQLEQEITVRAKIARKLEDSESKIRSFIEQSFEGIMILDDEGRIIEWNRSLEQITGVSGKKAIGVYEWDLLRDFLPEEQRNPEVFEQIRQSRLDYLKAGRQQAPIVQDLDLNMPDGSIHYTQVSMFPIGLAETCYFGRILRDVTEQKMTEMELDTYRTQLEQMVELKTSELVASQERLVSLSNNLPGGIVYQMVDMGMNDTRFTYISANFTDIFDISAQDAMADSSVFYAIIHPDDRLQLTKQYEQADKCNKVDIEYRIYNREDRIKWIHMRSSCHSDDDGVRVWDGFMIDITEHKEAEEARQQSEEMYRQLTVASPDAIVVCDLQRQIRFVSAKAMELFDIGKDEDINGLEILRYVHSHDRRRLYNMFDMLIEDNLYFLPQILMVRRNGSEFFGEISAASVRDTDEQITSIIMVIRDITQRKLNETELIRAKEKAEESDKLKSAFLANMSHEIRTPLNGIIGFLNFLTTDNLSPSRRQEYINVVNNSSKQLVKLIDDIIDIAKIEAKQLSMHPAPSRINELMDDLQMFFETYLKANNLDHLVIILDNSEFIDRCMAFIDLVRLRQVISNLIGNAIKFTEKGYIRFGYRQAAPGVLEFVVEDTGIGLTAEQVEVIFERFRQAEYKNNRHYGGTGLGLTISRSLVQLMGGEIRVESTEGSGSSFYFTVTYLPVDPEDECLFSQPPAEETKIFDNKAVLFVEPETMKYMYYERLLSTTGAAVTQADSLDQWIGYINQAYRFDAVFINASVFDSATPETISQIKSIYTELPTILLIPGQKSNYTQIVYGNRFDMILEEPVNYNALVKTLSRCIY